MFYTVVSGYQADIVDVVSLHGDVGNWSRMLADTLKWVFEILADNLNVVYLNPTKSAIRYSPSFQTECRNDLLALAT